MPDAPRELTLPDARSTPLPELVAQTRALVEARRGDSEALQDLEQQTLTLRDHVIRTERDAQELAHKAAGIYLTAARGVAAELPPRASGGRGNTVDDPFGFSAQRRKDYRDLLEPTDEEFLEWLKQEESPSKQALVAHGRALARKRDRETGEPLPSGAPKNTSAGGEPAAPGNLPAPEAAPPPALTPTAPEPGPAPGPDLTWGLARLRDVASFFAQFESPLAVELLRLARRGLAIAAAATNTTTTED